MPNFTGICVECGRPMQVVPTSAAVENRRHNACRKHGTSGYRAGCRCEVCKAAKAHQEAGYRERRMARTGVDPTTEVRRAKRGGAPLIPDCFVCGEPLKASARHGDPMHKECRPSSSFYVAPAVRLGIYERDGWVCQLCSYPVDRSAHYSTLWAPSLDHIVPRSVGPDHSPENLRCVHRFCNSLRGADRLTDAEVRARVDELLGVS